MSNDYVTFLCGDKKVMLQQLIKAPLEFLPGVLVLENYLLHRPSAGYLPSSVISFRAATTTGLSAA